MSLPEAQSTSVLFCGDFCLSVDASEFISLGVTETPWVQLRGIFGEQAKIVANLECSLTNESQGKPFKWANLKMPVQLHSVLDGISLAVLSNNHISDFSADGVTDTLSLLENKGIQSVGYGNSLNKALQPAFLEVDGKRLGVVALCCPTTNGENLATHLTPGVAPLGMATLKQAIEGARSQCDALVAYLHWGPEWVHDPAPDQLRLARHAIDCGADAVVGCHSHTIQSYEQYRGRWIFYGLGNYLFKAGHAQALRGNGEIENVPLILKPENQESLAVSFQVVSDTGNGCLSLGSVQAMRFGGALLPQPIKKSELIFDLDAANKRLKSYVLRNEAWLRDRSEPVFRARLLNGSAIAYWYSNESIVNNSARQFHSSFKSILGRGKGYIRGGLVICKNILWKSSRSEQ